MDLLRAKKESKNMPESTKPQQGWRYVLVAAAVCSMAMGTMGLSNAYGVFCTTRS